MILHEEIYYFIPFKIEDKIQKKEVKEKDILDLKEKIVFFQHERIIHLIITISFAFFTILFMLLGMISYLFLIPFFILIIFLLFYIMHYFFLENNVQYFYKVYDQVKNRK